jgi:hypothetical protein
MPENIFEKMAAVVEREAASLGLQGRTVDPSRLAKAATAAVAQIRESRTPPPWPPAWPSGYSSAAEAAKVVSMLDEATATGERMLGRPLSIAEGVDLAQAVRERVKTSRIGESAVTSFGEAAMSGRFGDARSPGLNRAPARTAPQLRESVAVPGVTDVTARSLAAMDDTDFHRSMIDYAAAVPFGARRLSDG